MLHDLISTSGAAGGEVSQLLKKLPGKDFFDGSDSRSSPKAQPDFQHKPANQPLWVDSSHKRFRVREEPINCGFVTEQQGAAKALSPSLIWSCCKNKDLRRGTMLHQELEKRGVVDQNHSDALVAMYAKCGEHQKAQSLLDTYNSRNIISWTALIAGYARDGKGHKALDCFEQMQHKGIVPNGVTYACILKACAAVGAIDKGKKVHDEILRQGLLEHDIVLGGALVDMYAKCGALHQAQIVLENLPSRNVVCWNALIAGYAQNGQGQQALNCFEQMQHEFILPNEVTYVCILKSCAAIGALDKGKEIHGLISRCGLLEQYVVLGNALVDMYAKCGALCQAQSVLGKLPSRNVISWGALIAGYAGNGQGQQALDCFEQMQHEGILPDQVIYVCVLKACATIGAIDKGKKVHDKILRQGLLEDHIVLGGALVDMYVKCGALCQAQSVLEDLPSRDVISWGSLIAGYAQNGQGQQALYCYEQMQREGILPDELTCACILKACAVIGDIDKGTKVHDDISRQGLLEHHNELGRALVDMYAKCGALCQAQSVLENLPFRDVISWSALIAGYAENGQGQQALDCFEQMQREGILPNEVTFYCLLNLCSHLGLVEKGEELFNNMEAVYGLKPDVKTFTCMVDLLGRAGHLVKAVEVIQGMPFSANSDIWHCLLAACRKWVDVNVGTWAFEQAIELDKCDGAAYISIVNIYAAAGMPEKAKDIEAMRVRNKAEAARVKLMV
ncbi:hypothetical protein GOP47_0010860 [Adiantum capillus-veneris]|uniref:Pentatricopeptide repeat-containing protein n=1 Tax=Adiantum capillus-veneris TaxID=13818 RepID=A0A9D4UVQ6_ADICA|nr:hypothetical protein GOP47_0010860 [Adiantum capillus-veneris]